MLGTRTGANQWDELLAILEPKLTAEADRTLLDAVRKFPGDPSKLRLDTKIAKMAESPKRRRPVRRAVS